MDIDKDMAAAVLAFFWWKHDEDAKAGKADREAAATAPQPARPRTVPLAWAAVSDEFMEDA